MVDEERRRREREVAEKKADRLMKQGIRLHAKATKAVAAQNMMRRAEKLLENPSDPVIWRGPVIAGVVKQFWNEVIWNDVDYMFVDMPPGTGDVPLTVFQSIPVDGVIIVTSPQDLVKMIVGKAVGMAHLMNIPILGIVENMSYVECPDCGKKINLYGESHTAEAAAEYGLKVLGSLPVDPAIAQSCDSGNIEAVEDKWLSEAVKAVEEAPAKPKA